MIYCRKCGNKLDERSRFCPVCGASAGPSEDRRAEGNDSFCAMIQGLTNTEDMTARFDPDDIQRNKGMAIIAYLGILVLVPLLAAKDSRFARYHVNQGLVLLIAETAYSFICIFLGEIFLSTPWRLLFIVRMMKFFQWGFLILAVIGIINAANGLAKEIPLVGRARLIR